MFSKKQHIVRKTMIVSVSFILGVLATVIAAATYDANIQNRAGSMLKSIKSNASTLPSSEKVAYYTLVHNNIQSLIQVLTGVDANVMVELGTPAGLDDGSVIDQITNTGTTGTGLSSTGVACGPRPSMGNPQSMDDYKAYMIKNYLEMQCTDYSYSSTILTGLEGTIQVSGDAAKLICDASTNYKWIFPNSNGLIPNGVHTCKVSDKCPPVPTSSKAGRKYTKTTYGFYSDEIVKTCAEANRGNGGGVYMEGSYPKCDASTNYKWKKLEYVEIGNTCDNATITNTTTPTPVCVDLQYEFQCNQAMNGKYKQLKFANGNTENITAISDCTATSFRYMTASSPTGWNGSIGAGWKACSEAPISNTTNTATTTPVPTIVTTRLYGVPGGANGYSITRGAKIHGDYVFSQNASNISCQVWYSKNSASSLGDFVNFSIENGMSNTSSKVSDSFDIDTSSINADASSFVIQSKCGGIVNGAYTNVQDRQVVTFISDTTTSTNTVTTNPITFTANTTSVSRGEIVNFSYAVSGNPNSCKVWYSTTSANLGNEVTFTTSNGVSNTMSAESAKSGNFSITFDKDASGNSGIFQNNQSQVIMSCYGTYDGKWQEFKKSISVNITGGNTVVPKLQVFNPITRDIVYKGTNKLDVFMPMNVVVGKKIPVYISVHGGGWMGGDKTSDEYFVKHFTDNGIAYVPIDYTLSNSSIAGSKSVYQEIDCSLKWVMAHKDMYNFDTNNINLLGGSAGGHLVLQYALNQSSYNDVNCSWGNARTSLHQVVAMAGPTDLSKDFSKTGGGDLNYLMDNFLGAKRGTSLFTQKTQENSPINFLNKDNRNIRYYLYHALNDPIVNYNEHAIPLYNAMKANNYFVTIDNDADGHDANTIPDAGFLRIFNQ